MVCEGSPNWDTQQKNDRNNVSSLNSGEAINERQITEDVKRRNTVWTDIPQKERKENTLHE